MYTILTIKHSVVTTKQLEEIIHIKSVAWNYCFEKQLSWIRDNISNEDIHVILKKDGRSVAYLNLVEIDLEINEVRARSYGIGNVCSLMKGKGYGKELMLQVNNYLTNEKKTGLLFCKELLVPFYTLCDWQLIEKSSLHLNFDNTNIETMVFNQQQEIVSLRYTDKSF